MTDWRPSSGPQAAARRAALLQRLRARFAHCGVLEVDTPALSTAAVSDVQIESLEIGRSQVSRIPLYLHTSPEFTMKRLLAAGYPDIYSICRVFRDGEAGRRHQPEFTMIEWYRLDMELADIVHDTIKLIDTALADAAPNAAPLTCDYRDLFLDSIGIDPLETDLNELAALGDDEQRSAVGDELDDWLDWLFATRIAPQLAKDRLTVVSHYPASQAALARLCPDDARVADRFEVFLGDVELANGYVELTDGVEQRRRIGADNLERQRRGRKLRPVDEALLAALEDGLPACAGVAMGLERLQMVMDNTDDIRDVITFAFPS
ncbi:MAG: EF-P lysine aminoacylase EpmA [Woeseiaceae bacterium]|nr:EF-P lysine aminoacylase EpmA [Woeseiaceae bacterium]